MIKIKFDLRDNLKLYFWRKIVTGFLKNLVLRELLKSMKTNIKALITLAIIIALNLSFTYADIYFESNEENIYIKPERPSIKNTDSISITPQNIINFLVGRIELNQEEKQQLDINKDTKLDVADLVKIITGTPAPTPTQTSTVTPTPTPSSGTIAEKEPNDTEQTAQAIGSLSIGSSIKVSGKLSSGGMQNNQYIGDPDFFSFVVPAQADVTLNVDWTQNADIDVIIVFKGHIIGYDNGTAKPLVLTGTLNAETFSILLVSKNNAADYNFTLSAAASTATYQNDNSLLNGQYQHFSGTTYMNWYIFSNNTNYQFWEWTAPSGDRLSHSGTYNIWYPFLVLIHSDNTVEFLTLSFSSSTLIYLDNLAYYKQ